MTGKCVIFSAPSGAGKTTIVKQLLEKPELKLEFSISATTREPREEEIHGKDYYFLTLDDFKNKIDQNALIEYEEVYENSFYGTLKAELERIWEKGNHVAFDIDVNGGLNLKKLFGEKALAIFVMPPSLQILEHRLRGRETDSEDQIKKRLKKAEYELSFAPKFDFQIVNDKLDDSVNEAYQLIKKFMDDDALNSF
jgi:guanylate kinase